MISQSKKLVLWGKDEKSLAFSRLSPVLTGAGVEIAYWHDTNSLPKVEGAGVILCLGGEQKAVLEGLGLVPKNRTVTSMRGKPICSPMLPAPILVSYAVTIGDLDYGFYVDLLTDTSLAVRFLKTGKMEPKLGNYKYVTDFTEAISYVEKMYEANGRPVEAALDLETVGLDPYALPKGQFPGAFIVSIQVSVREGESFVLRFPSKTAEQAGFASMHLIEQMEFLLNSPKISMGGANLKFDLHWLWVRAGLRCTNFKFDTTLVGSLLDENRSNGLDVHVKIYAPGLGSYSDQFDSTVDKSRMDLVDPALLLPYAGGDTDGCLQVRKAMKAELVKDKQLTAFYVNILHPAARAFELVEQGGVHVDLEKYKELEADLLAEAGQLVGKAKKILGGTLVAKHHDPDKPHGLNLTKASLLVDYLFSPSGLGIKPKMFTPKGGVSTAMEHLLMFKDHPKAGDFISLLGDYGSATKTLSTYVHGFLKHLRSDGRMHPSYFLAATGGAGGTTCLPASELVLTSRGYVNADKVVVGDLVLSHKGEPRKVTDFIVNGVKPLLKVTLSSGVELTTTENHPYLTAASGWVRADTLKAGDSVVTYGDCERWVVVPEWNDFSVSSWGRVLNTKTGRLVTQRPKGKWGHLKVSLYRNGAQKRGSDRKDFPVHRLVAEAFCSGNGTEVRHLNGVAWDNNAVNLVWGTAAENRLDAKAHGTMSKRNHWQAKLTDEAVKFIRATEIKKGGWTNKKLSEKFGVCTRLIRAVRNGQRWGAEDFVRVTNFSSAFVVSVEKLAPQMTYGVSVEVDNSHVTGGVVTHNTGRLSARDPAFQCLKGSSLVYNKEGWTEIESIVSRFECGQKFEVLTHTGEWKPVVGTYRNGVQPLLRVRTASGLSLDCTGNHPWLTSSGFVRADSLLVGDKIWRLDEKADYCRGQRDWEVDSPERFGHCGKRASQVSSFVRLRHTEGALCFQSNRDEAEQILWLLQEGQVENSWTCHQRASVIDLLVLAAHGSTLLRPERQGVCKLWRKGHNSVRLLERLVRGISDGHGGEACGAVLGQVGHEWELLLAQLSLGDPLGAGSKPEKQCNAGVSGAEEALESVGGGLECEAGNSVFSVETRVECGSSPYHSIQAHLGGFLPDTIVSIELVAPDETFDLTIEDSHSFVANGIVVHNTLPKHTKWGKRLRACYTAPPGTLIVMENDYSQGELRVIACVANDPVMIEAYSKGMDLHVVTGGSVAGYSYEEMLELKKHDPDKFDALRQLAKAGNFGLIYGMSAEGFVEYARASYGVALSLKEATDFRNNFFKRYAALPEYHNRFKTLAHRHGFVRSPLGRIRHLPLINSPRSEIRSGAERQAVNAPIQSTLSDMMIWAISMAHQQGWFTECPCFGQIHDAKYAYIPEDNFDFYVKREIELMENLPLEKLGWTPQLKFTADAKIGPNMGQLYSPDKYGK